MKCPFKCNNDIGQTYCTILELKNNKNMNFCLYMHIDFSVDNSFDTTAHFCQNFHIVHNFPVTHLNFETKLKLLQFL